MTERVEGVSSLFTGSGDGSLGIETNPADPRTWAQAVNASWAGYIPVSGGMFDLYLTLTDVPPKQLLTNARANVYTAAAVGAYLGGTTMGGGLEPYNFEAEALGAKLIYGPASLPTIDFREPFIRTHADLSKVKAPENWLDRGRIRLNLDIQKLNREMGNSTGMYCSPFSLAVALRSYPLLIRDMRRDPGFYDDLLSCLSEEILPSYLKVVHDYCGYDLMLGAAAWESHPNVTPEQIEAHVLPYCQRLLGKTMEYGVVAVTIGAADYCEEDPRKFSKDILFRCFDVQVKLANGQPSLFLLMGRTQDIPTEWIAEYLERFKAQGLRATMTMALNARLMRDGPVDEIVGCVRRFIDLLGRDHNLTIAGMTPAGTPPEHIFAAVAAARAYGKLPLADSFDGIVVEIPERETFAEFVDKMSQGQGLVL